VIKLFRRKSKSDDEVVDPNERSPQLGLKYKDLAVLGSLSDAGADLTQPRHVVFYLYFPEQATAERAGEVARGHGYTPDVRTPLPQYPGQWSLVCDRHEAVTSPAFVRDADNFFQDLADTHGGEYDGWEASV
jgi:hypothetical protein